MANTKPQLRSKADKRVIEYVSTSSLTPYARNSRTHSPQQVKQIAASIKEFGFTNPVLIDEANGIIAGHGRVMAAEHLQLAEVPCIRLEYLTETQKRAYVIADNKLALNAGWDEELLNIELTDLHDDGFDVGMIGFEADELSDLMGYNDKEVVEDEVPEPPAEPITKPGDLWVLGEHRLLCGDSTKAEDVERLMNGQLAEMLFTDPPWNVNYGAVQKGNPQGYKARTIINDHMNADDWDTFVAGFCKSFYMATKPGAPAYVVMSAQEWPSIDKHLRQAKFHWSSTIIWLKDSLVLSRKDYHTQYEPIWYGWNEEGPRIVQVSDRKQSDVWEIARPKVSELHPTTKPVELISRALVNSSAPSAIVIDLFGGSGSTLIAAEQLGRRCYGMEISPAYCDVIVKRWETLTGKKAVLDNA